MVDEFSPVALGDAIIELLVLPMKASAAITKGDVVKVTAHQDDDLPTIETATDAATTCVGVALQDMAQDEVGEVLVLGVVKVTAGAVGITLGAAIEAAAAGAVEAGTTAGAIIGRGLQTVASAATGLVFINCLGA